MAIETRASLYADGATILLAKEKVWSPGPIYMIDAPWERFAVDDVRGIQRFLLEILTAPTKVERGDLPSPMPMKEFLRLLQVRSLRQAVTRYECARIRVVDGTLIGNSYARDLQTTSWAEMPETTREPNWEHDTLGANAAAEVLRNSE